MKRFLCAIALTASTASAATFLVPADAALVRASRAIVVATAGESISRWAPGGWIETVTALHVQEAIKGPIHDGETIQVTELGGAVDSMIDFVPGAPRYLVGERVLLFLETNDRGEWVSKNMAVGKFSAVDGMLLRDAKELNGWDEGSGAVHREPLRDELRFLRYVRDISAGIDTEPDYFVPPRAQAQSMVPGTNAAPSISSYLEQANGRAFRWASFPVVYRSHGTQPGAPNGGLDALMTGLATWANGTVVLQYAGQTSASSGGVDGINSVQFNDPSNEIPGSFTAVGGATLAVTQTRTNGTTHLFGGETFWSISEVDLVVQDGITGAGLTGNGFRHVIAHELGHSIGFRHSDLTPDDSAPCSAPLSCSFTALMASTVDFNNDPTGAALQSWDREALAAVYGGQAPVQPCVPPSITQQPQSVSLTTSPVVLSVTATGDAPLHYQWYVGARENASQPIDGASGSAIQVQPAVSTMYWVRVSNACGLADSEAATVTVNGCPAVTINSISSSISIVEGKSTVLTASATGGDGLTYQWFIGTPGVISTPAGSGSSLTVQPGTTTNYWLRATNRCGAYADSDVVIVTVRPCHAPQILAQPSGGEVLMARSTVLFVADNGTTPKTYQWFEGAQHDASHPVLNATFASFTTPTLIASTQYWVRITNDCGTIDSASVAVNVVNDCQRVAIVSQPADQQVPAGSSAILNVTATGTSLGYQWYQGQVFDFTKPLGGSAPVLVTPPITAATQFWVRVTDGCGSAPVNSVAVTVGPASRRRPSH